MPVDSHKDIRYRILDKCFRNIYRKYDIEALVEECNKALVNSDYKPVSKRSIQEDIRNLKESPYFAEFDEKLKEGHKRFYRYKDPSFSLPYSKLSEKEIQKINEAIHVLSVFEGIPQYDWARIYLQTIESQQSKEVQSAVVFQNNPDLQGLRHFEVLVGVILNKQPIEIRYQSFQKEDVSYQLSPYLLKQYNERWYLIGKTFGYKNLSVFPLDRILEITQIHKTFESTEIDLEAYFDDCVGVSVDNHAEIENVLLKVSSQRFPYIETKPIHYSQTELKEYRTENSHVIRIKVKINKELEALLLSYGNDVEVLAPAHFRERLKQKIEDLHKKYQNNEENLHS